MNLGKEIMNIAVIGAGPVGGYAAYLLAKAGHQVSIYEEHAQVGCPIQCTGLLTADFDQLTGFPQGKEEREKYLANTFSHIEVYSPSGKKIILRQREYLVGRTPFDQFFVDLAVAAGAKLFLQHAFVRKEATSLLIRNTGDTSHPHSGKEFFVTPEVVIAADGPQSKVIKAYGFYEAERQNFLGIQATVQGQFDPTAYQAYFGQDICPGLFAWVVPESSTVARVGVGTINATKTNTTKTNNNPPINHTKKYFDAFLKAQGMEAREIQAGLIPVYHPSQKVHYDNCYALGDAAGFVKATTLGGLVPGLRQAEIVADAILLGKRGKEGDVEQGLKPLRRQLALHLKMHHIIQKMQDTDWERLFGYLQQEKVKKVLEEYTRDNPIPLVLKALLKEPRLLSFGKYLWG